MKRTKLATVAVLAVAAALAACSDAPVAVDPAIPPEVRDNALYWPLPGRDYANTRATTDSAIDSSNVATLRPAWQVELPGRGGYGNAAATPLITKDTVYFEDLASAVRAIDRETGRVLWTRAYGGFAIGPNGTALGWGKVFAIRSTEEIFALDAATGDELWRRDIKRTRTDGIDIQPTVYADLVFASSVPVSLNGIYTGGDIGVLHALRQDTGETVWTFDTVDSPDLWGNPEVNSGGGSWYTPAIDTERGVIYWAVANPAPFPGTAEFPNATSRPGPNLYTDSVVALDVRTGALDWYNQAIPHDLFDHDLIHTLLVDVGEGSAARRIVVATGKGGEVMGYDIETGEELWRTPVGMHLHDDLTMLEGPTEIMPGTFGGVLTPPAAADGVVYLVTLNAPSIMEPDVPEIIGGNIGTMDGEAVAIDAATGAVVWNVVIPGDPLGGMTVVNDLVFTSSFQGVIYALDRATGATVWTYQAPGGMNCPPAVAGDDLIWPIGLADPAVLLNLRLPR